MDKGDIVKVLGRWKRRDTTFSGKQGEVFSKGWVVGLGLAYTVEIDGQLHHQILPEMLERVKQEEAPGAWLDKYIVQQREVQAGWGMTPDLLQAAADVASLYYGEEMDEFEREVSQKREILEFSEAGDQSEYQNMRLGSYDNAGT